MMTEIYLANRELTEYLRLLHETCEKHNDIATASLIENWVDQAAWPDLKIANLLDR